jgi:tetratricopeptide (TPR) repeat protein
MWDTDFEAAHFVLISVNATPPGDGCLRRLMGPYTGPLDDPPKTPKSAQRSGIAGAVCTPAGEVHDQVSHHDDQLAHKMNKVAGASGSLTTIRRHRDGSGGIPTYRMLGIYQQALGIPENEIDALIDPDRVASPAGAPTLSDFNEQWMQLIEYLRRQSQLPHHIQNERARAEAAIKERDYDKGRKHLEKVSEWTRDSYREHEISLAYAAEEYGRALASLGALAFTSMNFAEARVQFLKALSLVNLSPEA